MRKLTALMMATTLVFGSVQLASAADATTTAPAAGEMQHHPKRGPMMDHMFKGLKLTEQQRQKMQEIARDSMKDLKRPSAAEHQQMHDVIAADSFDQAKAETLVDATAQEQKQRMVAHLAMQNKMYNVLTPEQKQEFNKEFKQRAEKMAEHGGK